LVLTVFVFVYGIIVVVLLITVIEATEVLCIEVVLVLVLVVIVIIGGEIRRGVGSAGILARLPTGRRGEAIVTRCRSPRPAATVAT